MKHKLTKDDKEQIKNLAKMLPEIPLATYEVMSGVAILGNDKLKHLHDKVTNPNVKYKVNISGGSPEAFNHEKRIKKAFINGGLDAVSKYVNQFKKHD